MSYQAKPNLSRAYLALRSDARLHGLHERTKLSYGALAVSIAALLSLCCYVLSLSVHPMVQYANATLLAFALVQVGLIAHDMTHDQVFRSRNANAVTGSLTWGLFLGISQSGWHAKHNAHHVHVNQDGADPDLEMPFIFSAGQTKVGWLARRLRQRQHVWFFILQPLVYPATVWSSIVYIVKHPSPVTGLELALIVLHFGGFYAITSYFLTMPTLLFFYVCHFMAAGIYLGFVFAPNHKGEEVIASDRQVTWLNQITSTRNIIPSTWAFILFGGLNFQIEHHLFPSISRFKTWDAHRLVKAFCERNAIRYHETTWAGSIREIYRSLKVAGQLEQPHEERR